MTCWCRGLVAWCGSTAILGRRRTLARLRTTPLLGLHGEDRRAVAQAARRAILEACALPVEVDSAQAAGTDRIAA